ncbi:MAG TPA: amidohydrolase family protein [Mycobacteriales bacterium]|nr:amidohydrolase family protein [Mycobacteriales bacterium]
MSERPARIVDAHVHLWDPARTDWYPYLSGRQDVNVDVSGSSRRFDVPTYRKESAGWNVVKLVNVAAATGKHSVAETLAMDAMAAEDAAAEGHPDAIVGGLPRAESIDEAIGFIDEQRSAPRFRGVRPMIGGIGPLPDREVLVALAERGLVFELMAHPDTLADAARTFAGIPDLDVVVEHTGWPRDDSDEERALWSAGLEALASVGERVSCKLSGLAMPLGSMSAEVLRPWVERAIETFGAHRCMFASNFPVDGAHGTWDELYSSFNAITAGLPETDRDQLFAGTAERVFSL